jgi:hypothetical protein
MNLAGDDLAGCFEPLTCPPAGFALGEAHPPANATVATRMDVGEHHGLVMIIRCDLPIPGAHVDVPHLCLRCATPLESAARCRRTLLASGKPHGWRVLHREEQMIAFKLLY